jgi:signal peptidase
MLKVVNFFLIFFLLLITTFFLFSKLNFPGNYKILLVQSGSMSPAINTGDLVIVKPSSKYKKGDIVTFLSKGKITTTHRIADIQNNQIITKGDANQVNDQGFIEKEQILGKVFYNLPNFGYLVIFIKSIPGLIIFIIIPTTIIVYQEFVQIKNNFKKMSKR